MKNTPAFPTTKPLDSWGDPNQGMDLRDYFAAKAMQVVLYQCDCYPDTDWRDGVAMDSYKMADAMLCAREAK